MWSVDSQDWRITAGGQTEAGLLANVTEWANSISKLTQGGNSLMHDLNNVTVGAALKSLPILHPKVKLSPVSECAGWKDASYLESPGFTNPQASASASASASVPAGAPAASNSANPSATVVPAAKKAEGAAAAVVPAVYATALVSLTALISSIL
jgi:ADP-ribosylglycohydrolase